jgi:transcription initiation factor TFIID subunit 5
MSATPDGESPQLDGTDAYMVNGIPINRLSGRDLDQLAAHVLEQRGWTDLAAAIQSRSGGLVSGVQAHPPISSTDLVNRHRPGAKPTGDSLFDKPDISGRVASVFSDSGRGLREGRDSRDSKEPRPKAPQSSLTELRGATATQLLIEDPLNRQEAFRDLQAWVEGSLDMYKARGFISDLHSNANWATARVQAPSFSHLCSLLSGPCARKLP